jgi:hypothetical protein
MYRNSLTDNCVYKVYLTINDDIILSSSSSHSTVFVPQQEWGTIYSKKKHINTRKCDTTYKNHIKISLLI